MKKILIIYAILPLFIMGSIFLFVNSASAVTSDAVPYQVINLGPGWNIVSTPRVLLGHEFSVAETSDNLAIYLLDPTSTSGWRTMQATGQTEFQPLFAYFIYNKTSQPQTLKLNYDFNLSPEKRLFQRTLNPGWNAIGIASPDYAVKQGTLSGDTNNPNRMLNSITGSISQVVDFTADQPDLDSVKIGNTWASKVASEVNGLKDFRELKGYAVFVAEATDDYFGSQNINDGFQFSVSSNNPAAIVADSEGSMLFSFQVYSLYDVNINALIFSHSGTGDKENLSNFQLYDADTEELLGSTTSTDSDGNLTFPNLEIGIGLGEIKKLKLIADIDLAAEGRTHKFMLGNATLDQEVTITGLPISNTLTVSTTAAAGTLTVSIDAAYNPASQTYVKGTSNRLFTALKFATVATEGVRVVKLKLKVNNGSGSATDISNITLWDGSIQRGGPVSLIGSYAIFGSNTVGWDSPGLFDVEASSVKTILVKADIPSGATTGRTVDLDIATVTDIWADGLTSQYDLPSGNIVFVSGDGNLHTIASNGNLTISKSDNSPAAQVYVKGETAKEFLRFNLASGSGEDIAVSNITINCYTGDGLACPVGYVANAKLLKSDGSQYGPTVTSPGSPINFSGSLTVPASETAILKVIADIPSTSNATTVYMSLAGATNIVSTGVASAASITESGSAIGSEMTIDHGSLTVDVVGDPAEQIKVIGETNTPFVNLIFAAGSGENIRVTYVKLTKNPSGSGSDSDISNVALYDGNTRLTDKKNLTSGYVAFSASDFLNGQGFDVTKGSQKIITIKADISSTAVSGDIISLGMTSAADVIFTGLVSNINPDAELIGDDELYGNYQIIRRSKPTIAAASLPSTALDATTKTLYRWTVTVNPNGNIGWRKVIFDMSGSIQVGSDTYTIGAGNGTSTDGVYMATDTIAIAKKLISTLKVYNVATGDEFQGSVSVQNFTTGGVRINFVSDTEQTVAAGTTNTYELRGDIAYAGKAGDSLSTKIAVRSTNLITDIYANVAGTEATLVWTDRSAVSHSETTSDWTDDYKVSGLPTATLSLIK